MNSVLIIDDDKELCTLMKKCVEQENLSAVVAHGGLEGLRLLEENKDTCSLIILDVMMPDMNGFQVLQEIRKKNNVPVRLGADDYLTKPFGINELMARVNSLIRRYTTLNPVAGSEAATMLLKDMVIDKVNRTVTLQNLPVELTGKEFDLLVFLASNKGRVFTKKQIYTQVWAEEYAFDDSNIMSFISKLRKKIEPNPEQPFYIQTVRGVSAAGAVGHPAGDRLSSDKAPPCPGPAFPYQRCPDGHKERQPQPPCTCTGKRHDKANLL